MNSIVLPPADVVLAVAVYVSTLTVGFACGPCTLEQGAIWKYKRPDSMRDIGVRIPLTSVDRAVFKRACVSDLDLSAVIDRVWVEGGQFSEDLLHQGSEILHGITHV